MKSVFRKILVWQLVLCMLAPTLPLEWTQGIFSSLQARAEAAEAAREVEDGFLEIAQRAQEVEALREGDWLYAVVEPEHYAVVLGHADASAQELTVPAVLGGADVVAVAQEALSGHKALESISLPGNVNAVGQRGIPAGTLVRGYHGTYAQTYALGNGHAFQSLSEYDFARGVIDYADVRREAFVRHSAYSLSLRALEAARLRVGSVFFLIDPDNAYQISYYRVLALEEQADGFVSVSCETPVMDDVLLSFSGQDEEMRLDPSTLVLGEGVSYVAPRMDGDGMIDEINFPLTAKIPFSDVDVTVTGMYRAKYRALDYSGKQSRAKQATIEHTESMEFTVTVERKDGFSADSMFYGDISSIGKIAERAGNLTKKLDTMVGTPYRHPLGIGYVFSYAGILTLQAQFHLDFEIKGSGTLEYISETVTTLHGDTDGNSSQKTEAHKKDITGSAQLEGKVGVRAEANLYILCACVFQVSGFVGLEAKLKLEIVKFDLTDGKGADFDKSINMMDCLMLEVSFVVDIGIRAGLIKVFNVELPFEISVSEHIRLVDRKLVDKHLHMLPTEIQVELLSGDLTFGGEKDQEHDAADCPYGKSSLEVRLSIPVEKQKALYMQFDHLDPGFTINEPEDPTVGHDDYRLTYWYNNTLTKEENRVTFPYEVKQGENLIYGRILKKYDIHFIYEDGTAITEPVHLFPGDTFTLPATQRPTIKWLRVQSPYNIKEHHDQLESENGVYKAPFSTTDIYLCAFEAPEIKVTFYESVDGGLMYETGSVVSKAGQTVEAPETTMSAYYEDAGWMIVGSGDVTMPYTIPVEQTEPIKLVHFLGMRPAEDDYTWISGSYPTPATGQSGHFNYDVVGSGDDAYAVIYGRYTRWTDDEGNDHYSPTVNLIIPSTIDGVPVKVIEEEAFMNLGTLETVTLPYTITRVADNAFRNCTSLRKVEASAINSSFYIDDYAFAGCTALTDFTVGSGARVHYRLYSFTNSGIVTAPRIASMENAAFSGCANLQSAELLEGCTSVPVSAFRDCARLRDIQIPSSVRSIGTEAFINCASLLEIELPYGIDSYGGNLFKGCTSLKKLIAHGGGADTVFDMAAPNLEYLEIGEGFTEITASLYKYTTSLQTLLLPSTLETIGDYAFYGVSVSEIDFPEGLKSVGKGAFAENPFLGSVELTTETMGEGVFMNCPVITSAVLAGMPDIPAGTFDGCVSLESISIPPVSSIGQRAFYGCVFEEIQWHEGIESIGARAFYNCRNLTDFHAPSALKTIGAAAFYGCESLDSITLNEGLTELGDETFAWCPAVEEIILPDTVAEIGDDVIYGCSSLKKLYISGGWNTSSNPDYETCFRIGEVNNLEHLEIGEGVASIYQNMFDNHFGNLKTILFPSTLKTIVSGTLQSFGMREVVIRGELKTIGSSAFEGCPNLETVIIEGNHTEIAYRAFASTPQLRTVSFKGVETLYEYAFQESCVESVVLAEGIKKIDNYVFFDCTQLESLSIASTLEVGGSGVLHNCPSLKELRIGGDLSFMLFRDPGGRPMVNPSLRVLEIRDGITVIPEDLFAGKVSELEELILPDGLVEIQRWGFQGLSENIRELRLPDSLEIISFGAFEDSHLETIDIPASVRDIRSSAFANSRNLRSVTIHGENVTIGDYAFENCTSLQELNVRGSIQKIGGYSFRYCDLRDVDLRGTITSVGNMAFANNPSLRTFAIHGENATLGNGIVSYCPSLEYLYVGGVETITKNMFNYTGGTPGIRHIDIGEGVKTIGQSAFCAQNYTGSVKDYSSLETVTLPRSLEVIDDAAFRWTGLRELAYKGENLRAIDGYAFEGCKQLERVELDGAGIVMGNRAFYGCSALKTVRLGSGVKSIGEKAFSDCDLHELSLSEGLETIGGYAFNNNLNLKSAVLPNSVTSHGYTLFQGCTALERLHIGAGADLSKKPDCTVLTLPNGVKHVQIAEGPAELAVNGVSLSSGSKLETIVFPESLTVINTGNLKRFAGRQWVKLSSSMTSIVSESESYTSSKPLMLVSDTRNDVIAQYAQNTGATYVPLDEELPEYTVEYYVSLNGQAGAEPLASGTAGLFEDLALMAAPTQENMRFTGWYYDAACTVPAAQGDRVSGNVTLYAGFMPHETTLFALRLPLFADLPGTEQSDLVPEGFVLYEAVEQTGESLVLPQDPWLDGYVFTGWHRDTLFNRPFEENGVLPGVLYGTFEEAGRGGLTQANATGVTLLSYSLMESDSGRLILPETVNGEKLTAIGAYAFRNLPITEVVIPAHVAQIDPLAFHGAAQLCDIHVSPRNTQFSSVNGVLYSADGTEAVRYPQGRRASGFVLPETVRSISERAFENAGSLKSITLPEGLESIGENAFARTGLKSVSLPDSVKILGAGAFEACTSLREFRAYGLETIGSNALPTTPSLAVRGPILQGALRSHVLGTAQVNLRYNIRYLNVMEGEAELTSHAVEAGAPLPEEAWGEWADEGRTVYALCTDAALTQPIADSFVMPDEDLTVYADVRSVFESASITLETGETGLVLTAYNGDGGEVVLPQTLDGQPVIALGESLMANARGRVTAVTIGSGVISIADTALCGPGGAAYTGSVLADAGSHAAQWAAQMGYACEGSIYTLTFNTLGGARIAAVQAASGALVRLPVPVKTGAAFGGWYLDEACANAAELTEDGLFSMPAGSLTLYALWTQTGETVPFTWKEEDGGVVITGYTGSDAHPSIPETINGLHVTAVADRAFMGNAVIRTISLPDTLLAIGSSAFASMEGLSAIVIPDSVQSIGYAAFRYCEALTEAHIGTGLETLGEQAFYGASSLEGFTCGEGGAFSAVDGMLCSGNTLVCVPAGKTGQVSIPDSIESIAPYAMALSRAQSVTFPAGLADIGTGALYNCDSLKEITFGEGEAQLAIPERFAAGSDSLEKVTLGSSVFAVGSSAFVGCTSLAQAHIAPQVAVIGQSAFAAVAKSFTITGTRGSAAQTYAVENGVRFVSAAGDDVKQLLFAHESLEMVMGEHTTLEVAALPAMPEGEVLRWSSSDRTVADVTDGLVRCVGRGTATITAEALNGVSASMVVSVRGVPAQSVSLSAQELFVPLNGQSTFAPILTPAWADSACTWRVADESIATVDENGTVSGLVLGTTTLHVITASGLEASAALTVFVPTEAILLPEDQTALNLNVIDSAQTQLNASVSPAEATFPQITYESADPAVVTVSETGLITVVGVGETTVTLTNSYTTGEPAVLAIPVTVSAYDISGVPAPEIPDRPYDGYYGPADFDLIIGGKTLKRNTDYTLTNDGSSELGTHLVTITGKGLFTGEIIAEYRVVDKQVTITYEGDTAFEEFSWYDIAQNVRSNVDRYSVKQSFAPASDPTNWTEETPTEYGEYILRLSVEDSYGVKGCELLLNVRLVPSLIESLSFTMPELHLLTGQSVHVLLDHKVVEGADIGFPYFTYTVEGTEGLMSVTYITHMNDRVYPRLDLTAGMEGTVTLTVSSNTYAVEPAVLTVHVHGSAQRFALPGTTHVKAEAFLGTQANVITLGGKPLTVGSRAFADSENLWQVAVPKGTTDLSADLLEGSDQAVVLLANMYDTAGISRAIELGIPFAVLK